MTRPDLHGAASVRRHRCGRCAPPAGDRQAAVRRGLEEAVAYAEGAADENEYGVHIPAEIDVKAIRARPSMTSRSPISGVRATPAADVFKWRGNGGERRSHLCSRVAERVGFEPTVRLRAHLISSQARSTTPAPLRLFKIRDLGRFLSSDNRHAYQFG